MLEVQWLTEQRSECPTWSHSDDVLGLFQNYVSFGPDTTSTISWAGARKSYALQIITVIHTRNNPSAKPKVKHFAWEYAVHTLSWTTAFSKQVWETFLRHLYGSSWQRRSAKITKLDLNDACSATICCERVLQWFSCRWFHGQQTELTIVTSGWYQKFIIHHWPTEQDVVWFRSTE